MSTTDLMQLQSEIGVFTVVSLLVFVFILTIFCLCVFIKLKHDQETVKENSEYLQSILALNVKTSYHTISKNRISYHLPVNSKAKFDRITSNDALTEIVTNRQYEVEQLVQRLKENRIAYSDYETQFNKLFSRITEDRCTVLNIPYGRFIALEDKLAQKYKLNIIYQVEMECVVTYTSPQGRNSYRKGYSISNFQIERYLENLAKEKQYRQTEEFRRKNERARVTQSVRYDVMKRDGFRCRLCGRSAKNYVELEVDHIIPISRGGTSDCSNLQTLCKDCNRGKGAK